MRAQNAGKIDPLESLFQRVSEAAAAYESRWTLSALERVNPELYEALLDQRNLWHEAFVTHAPDTVIHGESMIRGWQAATRAMEEAGIEDDAYMIGRGTVQKLFAIAKLNFTAIRSFTENADASTSPSTMADGTIRFAQAT